MKNTNAAPVILSNLIDELQIVQRIHVTTHKSTARSHSKLDGLQSVSTSALANDLCAAHRNVEGSICQKCYATTMAKRFSGLNKNNMENGDLLQTYLIGEGAWALLPINTIYARIESFGDVANVTQARNYIRIVRSHPLTNWGIWSKNAAIWAEAFRLEGKPSNCTYVHSSMFIDRCDDVPASIAQYVDHTFTVYNKKTNHEITCGGRQCATCLRCYRKDTPVEVAELQK